MSLNRRRPTPQERLLFLSDYKPIEVREGAMSLVFICWNEIDAEKVAIKVMRPELSYDNDGIKRWLTECYAWMKLGGHANIVQPKWLHILDARPQLVLEYVPNSLRDRLGTGEALSPVVALKYAIHMCRGLGWAVTRLGEFVHRDLKPENILIDDEDIAKVTDFGLIAANGAPSALAVFGDESRIYGNSFDQGIESGTRQRVGISQVGTALYMSPEQIRGDEFLNACSDVYALGCILYEMLAGHFVFPHIVKLQPLLRAHLRKKPRQLNRIRPDLPMVLVKIVAKCLHKVPSKRFPDANTLCSELERVLHSEFDLTVDKAMVSFEADNVGALYSLIDGLIKLGSLKEARKICLRPDSGLSNFHKFFFLATLEKCADNNQLSIDYVDRCVETAQENCPFIEPEDLKAWALNTKATALEPLGQIDEAIQLQTEALDAAQKNGVLNGVLWANLGRLHKISGDRNAALKAYKKSLAIEFSPETVEQFVGCAVAAGSYDSAQHAVTKAISVFGADPRFCFLMAHVIVCKLGLCDFGAEEPIDELVLEGKLAVNYAEIAIQGGYFVDQSREYQRILSEMISNMTAEPEPTQPVVAPPECESEDARRERLQQQLRWKESFTSKLRWSREPESDRYKELQGNPKSVFILYSWDSKEHYDWVGRFAAYLQNEGFDVVIDQVEQLASPDRMLTLGLCCRIILHVVTPLYIETRSRIGTMQGFWANSAQDMILLNLSRYSKILTVFRSGNMCFCDYPITDCHTSLPDSYCFGSSCFALKGDWKLSGGVLGDPNFLVYESRDNMTIARLVKRGDHQVSERLHQAQYFIDANREFV